MELKKLSEIAAEKAAGEGKTTEDRIGAVSKNLSALWLFSDEMPGVFEALGGREALSESLSKAIMNIFCLAEAMGVDIEGELERRFGAGHPRGAEVPSQPSPPAEATPPAPGGKPAEEAPAAEEQVPSNGKGQKIAMYEKALKGAKNKAEANRIWMKEIGPDRDLGGKDKAALQKVYKEVLNGLSW